MTIPLHMLLVEDSPDDAQLIALHLEQAGLDVDCRRVDTEAAFIAALDTTPDVILSDYALPQFDGLRALHLLTKRGLDIPFILISGMVGEEIAVEAIKHGADDYLMKDQLGRLGPAIQHALEQKRLRDEKAHADEALRQSQQAYQSLVNTVDGIVWAADANTFEFQFVSQQAERLFGYPIERWMNEPTFWKDHIHPDDRTWAVDYCIACTHDKLPHQFDYRMIAADGRVVWLRDIVAVIVENDQAVKLRGIMVDITAQKHAEEKLRISEERLNLALTAANDGLWDWNVQTGAVYFSPRWKAMIGYAEDELPNTYEAWYSRLHADDRPRVLQALQAHFADAALHYEPEFRMRTKTGEWIWIQARGRVVEHDREGRPLRMIGMHSDITERKRAEEERRQLEARMQQAQKLESLGVLAGGIAHDFNNLLTSMLGYAGLALMELPAESVACPMLREIEQAARRAADLTQQLLAYSGRGKFVIQVLQLDTLVREMTKLLEMVVSKKVTLHLDLAPAAIEADATQIRQIVMNLITNASDALEGRSGVIGVRTGVQYADAALLHSPYLQEELPAGDYAYVEVEDNGCGMTEETLARIFDPFFTTKFTGRGLGLAAVLGIAKGHQGTIKVASAADQGTVFQALFPCARAVAGESAVAGSAGAAQRGYGTVLVVEDEESIRSFTRRVLERAGFQVREAADGRAGLDLFVQYAPEIVAVLLDLTMPRMDGQEVLLQLRRLDPNVPVLVMSGYSDLEVSARFAGMGASGFIQKPFHPGDLSALVCRMVPSITAIG